MGAMDDFVNSLNAIDDNTKIIIIVAVAAAIVVIILAVYLSLRKKKKRQSMYYAPPAEPVQPKTYSTQLRETPDVNDKGQNDASSYPGSVMVVGNYTLFDDRIQISPRKAVFYDEITNVRYESNYNQRVVITIGHAWELSLTAQDQTLKLYRGIMSKMNSSIVIQHRGRKSRMLK